MIYIVGLGASDEKNIKESIKDFILEKSKNCFVLTRIEEHPAVKFLRDNNINYETCDKFYIANDDFSNTYDNITKYILECEKEKDVLYLVPGHPMVAEKTTTLLLTSESKVEIVGGESFLDSCFNVARFDPSENFSLLDATDINSLKQINPKFHTLITQCYDNFTAGDIYLELCDYYGDEYLVLVMENIGLANERIFETKLCDLQFNVGEKINNLRTIYIPPLKNNLTYNVKHLIGAYEENITDDVLIKNIERALYEMKNLKNAESDEMFSKLVADILKNTLKFQYSLDHYIMLEDILKNMNNG